METRRLVHPDHYLRMSGEELGQSFLVEGLFTRGEVKLVHWEGERSCEAGVARTRSSKGLQSVTLDRLR